MTVNPRDPWQERWQQGRTRWDQAGPHPLFEELLGAAKKMGGLQDGARIYEPGCGRAHNAHELARRGYEVVAADFVPEAVAAAKALYSHPRLTLRVEDALNTQEEGTFDAVFDRAMLCALDASFRPVYIAAVAKRLKAGGLFMSLPFAEVDPAYEPGPPFALSEKDLMTLLEPYFTIASWARRPVEDKNLPIRAEYVVVARKVAS